MAPGISFGHFNIVGGSVQEDGPYVGVIEDRTPAESIADLYLVLEPAQDGSDAFCAELLTLIETQFGRPQYSLTGNLLQALRAAQEHLRSWNKTAPPDRQAAVGAACLAVSGNQAYLAQIGPGLVYLRHDGLLRRIQAIEPEARAPLGTSIACSPEFSRVELSQGDSALLVSSRFAALVDDSTADQILSLPPADALPAIYKFARQQPDFSALFLAVTGELQPPPIATSEGLGLSNQQPASRVRRNSGEASLLAEALPEESIAGPPAPLAHQFDVAGAALKKPRHWFMQRSEFERLTERHQIALPRPALYTFAALVVLALAGWLGVPHLLQTGRQDRFTSLIRDARGQQAAGNAARDAGQKRTLFQRAQADLVEARAVRPQDPDLASLDADLTRTLQALNQVRPLASIATVVDLATTPIAARSVTDLVALSRVYVLDGSTGKVYAFDPNRRPGQVTPVFESSMAVESIQTGQAVHLAAQQPANGQPALLYILDSNRRLFTLDDAGTLRAVNLAGAGSWKTATALTMRDGDLYVLDGSGNQIWRFAGSELGFITPPVALLSKADLHGAAQLSVLKDVYISTSNGQLSRLHDGHLEIVALDGIDHPLTSPQPPQVDSSSGLELIADPGNQRIVAADSNDVFRYQYAGIELQGLRAIAVDPVVGVLYALSGQKIVSSPLP
ncbi:MAG TPA: hypothetical protein VK821_10185 [Dehalococcoidia bacterium]|nr:hypothetical protein [Dehalococcoidia bacterium]